MVRETAEVRTGQVRALVLYVVNNHCASTSGYLDIPEKPPVVLPDPLIDDVSDSVGGEKLEGRHVPGNREVDHHAGGIVQVS